jgi:WD40 repeat protein
MRWDLTTGERLPDQADHKQNLLNLKLPAKLLEVAPDGKRLIAWVPDGARGTYVNIYDLAEGKLLQESQDTGRNVGTVSVTPDGKRAALGAAGGSVRIYDLTPKWTLQPGGDWNLFELKDSVSAAALSADGKILVVGNDQGTVKICDVENRKDLHTLKGHTQQVSFAAVSPDGKRCVTVDDANVIRLWDVATGKDLLEWEIRVPMQVTGNFCPMVAFTPDGKHIVTANSNTTMYVLQVP